MKFSVVTLFPELIESFKTAGLVGQAVQGASVTIETLNPRKFTSNAHHTVDDKVFGGGDGMVMMVEPLKAAIDELRAQGATRVVVLTPQGRRWNQAMAEEMARKNEHVVLICGRYAGIDQRLIQFVDDEISLGDFILNGGEVAACAVMESVARLKPGVLGNEASAHNDSFQDGLLECPQFTRPREIEGMKVPLPLLSGNHKKIQEFTKAVAQIRTQILRPDLAQSRGLSREISLLEELPDDELKSLSLTRQQLQDLKRQCP